MLSALCATCEQAADIILHHLIPSTSTSHQSSSSSDSSSNSNSKTASSSSASTSRAKQGALQFKPTADDPFADDFLNGSFLPTALTVSASISNSILYSDSNDGTSRSAITAQLWVHKKMLNTASATSGTKTVQDIELYVNNAR
jgi:hypothetical protein